MAGCRYTKRLGRQKCLALKKNKGNYEGKIFINKIIIEELQWWLPKISISTGKIKIHDYDFEIYSDASKTGWGIYCKICKGEKHTVFGVLNNYHIT